MTGARVLSAALLLLCLFAPAFAARGAGAGEPGQAHRRLAAELERLAATIDGEVGVAAWPLDDPGHAVTLNADRRFPMASTYKVAIAGAVLARAGRGELRLPDMVPVPRPMYVPSDLIASGLPHDGVALSVHNLLELMLTRSDNTATDVLMALAGGPQAVTAWVRAQGIDDLRVDRDTAGVLRDFFGLERDRPVGEALSAAAAADPALEQRGTRPYPPFDGDPRDTTTPRAMAMLLARLFSGEALDADGTKVLEDIMSRCRTCDARLRGRMPPGTPVADKSGTIGGTVNDVGVVTLPDGRRVVMAVFVARSAAPVPERERVIAEIARTVRDYFLFLGGGGAR